MPSSPLAPLYRLCGALAAFCLAMIGVLIALSIANRLLALGLGGLANYAGYCMAAASFLALAYTFAHGGHIRVTLVLNHLPAAARRPLEVFCLLVAAGLAGYLAWYAVRMVRVSEMIRDISQGPDATPLWIPQLSMAVGSAVLALAIAERLLLVLRGAAIEDGSGREH